MIVSLSPSTIVGAFVTAWLIHQLGRTLYNYFLHPLSSFAGPRSVSTAWYRTYQELVQARNWLDVLRELHEKYGPVVRVGPNEVCKLLPFATSNSKQRRTKSNVLTWLLAGPQLHFSTPAAYHDIYNNANRWDKEATLYHSFGEDRSSFGFLTYREAKQRRDVLAPMFSRRAILELQHLVVHNADRLCEALGARERNGQASDVLFAVRAFTLDTIMMYCFGRDVRATEAVDFRAPIVVAMDATLPSFVVFRNFDLVRRIVFSFPGWLTRLTNPALAGLVDLQELLGAQVTEVVRNPQALAAHSHPIVYHRLLDPDANRAAGVPPPGSLYEEAQALTFAGADTSGNVAMLGTWHILQDPEVLHTLKTELKKAWPSLNDMPKLEQIERLPYLNAVIKESLRMAPNVPTPLPRIVPPHGATISGRFIPPGTIVGVSVAFVHNSADCFEAPAEFRPSRWLQPDAAALEKWFVAFSKGPRMCLGQNLAISELQILLAVLFRRFDIELAGTKVEDLSWRECFLPLFNEKHMQAYCRRVKD